MKQGGRMAPRAGLALLVCTACTSDPYVVAESSGKEGLPYVPETPSCKVGRYVGKFFTWPGSPGLQLTGEIAFELVRVQVNGAEFTQFGPTKLAGKDVAFSFSADVRTEYCVAGTYSTEIENGSFVALDAEGNPNPAAAELPFRGTIDGAYMEKFSTFSGRWATYLSIGDAAPPPGTGISGGWAAKLVEE